MSNCNNCNNCQQTPCNPCSQQTPYTQPQCACPVFLSSDCVNNVTEDLTCSNILKGQTLTEVLVQLDAFICEKFDSVANFLSLINVGNGAEIYKGDTLLGKKQLRSLVEGGLITIVEGTDDITISVDVTALNEFIEANQKTYSTDNVGTGAEVFKDNTVVGDNTQFNLKTLKLSDVGTGVSIIDEIDSLTSVDELDFKLRTLVSDSINITLEGDEVRFETPEDISIKQFYVNANYVGVETGSILKPYKKLTSALVAAIGSGTIANPEFEDANIILQSDVFVSQADLDLLPILEDKISVNTLVIKSEDSSTVFFSGDVDYPVDTEFLIDKVGVDVNLDLNRSVHITFDNVSIHSETVKGVVRSQSYNRGVIDTSKPNASLSFSNGFIAANYTPIGAYVLAKDSLNNDIIHFGTPVFVQDSILNDTPHVLAYGLGVDGQGHFKCTNSTIIGTSQTHFKLLNTTFASEALNVTTNTFKIPTQDATPITPGIYLPKSDVYKIHIESSYCRISKYEDGSDYANNPTEGNAYVGGLNSYFRCENPTAALYASFFIDEGFVFDGRTNYILETDKDFVSRNLVNCNFTNLITEISAFNYLGVVAGDRQVYIEKSSITNVDDPSVTNITVEAVSANVNNFPFTSIITFADNAAALAGGLIPGNVYYNTATNVATRVV